MRKSVLFAMPLLITSLMSIAGAQEADTETSCDRSFLRQMVFSARTTTNAAGRAVTDVRVAASKGDWLEVYRQTQMWIDRSPATMVWDNSRGQFRTLRQIAIELRNQSPATERSKHNLDIDVGAQKLWRDAQAKKDPTLLRELVTRYPEHPRAADAWDRLGMIAWDRKETSIAIACWSRVVNSPVLSNYASPSIRVRMALAYEELGQNVPAERLLQGARPIRMMQQSRSAGEWFSALRQETPAVPRVVSLTKPLRSASKSTTRPALSLKWTTELWQSNDPESNDNGQRALGFMLDSWAQSAIEIERSPVTTLNAIRVDDLIITNTYGRLTAVDGATGKVRWNLPMRYWLPDIWLEAINSHHSSRYQKDMDPHTKLEQLLIGNNLWSGLATDGERLFVVEPHAVPREALLAKHRFSRTSRAPFIDVNNRLIAYTLAGDSKPELAWQAGGKSLDSGLPLAGHVILGEPFCSGGTLFTASELDGGLWFSALNSATGRIQWSRPCLRPLVTVQELFVRSLRGMQFVLHDDVLLCVTRLGAIFGIDPATGDALWTDTTFDACRPPWDSESAEDDFAEYGDDLALLAFGGSGFRRVPLVDSGVLYHMAHASDQIVARDLRTGQVQKTFPRRTPQYLTGNWKSNGCYGDEYLAAVHDQALIIVGSHYVRAIDRETGEERWLTQSGRPAGEGCRVGTDYLLPVTSGEIIPIDLNTGRIDAPYRLAAELITDQQAEPLMGSDRSRPGNLMQVPGGFVSVSPTQLAFIPDLDSRRKQIQLALQVNPSDESAIVNDAVFKLATGDIDATRAAVASLDDVTLSQQNTRLRSGLIRSMSQSEIQTIEIDELPRLHAELMQQITSAADQSRITFTMLRRLADAGRFDDALLLTDRLMARPLSRRLMPSASDPLMRVSPRAELSRLIGLAMRNANGVDVDTVIAAQLDKLLDEPESNIAGMHRFLWMFAERPEADVVRQTLAEIAITSGEYQRAELLLLANANSSQIDVRVRALTDIVLLLDKAGLGFDAINARRSLLAKHSRFGLDDGLTVEQRLAPQNLSDRSRQALRMSEDQPLVSSVSISQREPNEWNGSLQTAYRPDTSTKDTPPEYQISIRRRMPSSREDALDYLHLWDSQSATILGTLRAPIGGTFPRPGQGGYSGHLLFTSWKNRSSKGMNAISLLQTDAGRPLWTVDGNSHFNSTYVITPGPAGARFCTYHTEGTLVAIDPLNGEVLWRRNGIGASSMASRIFGDDRALVIVNSTRDRFITVNPRTGEVLSEGRDSRFQSSLFRPSGSFGRHYISYVRTASGFVLEIWDGASNKVVYRQQPSGAATTVREGDYIVTLDPLVGLTIFSLAEGREIVSPTPGMQSRITGPASLSTVLMRDQIIVSIRQPVLDRGVNWPSVPVLFMGIAPLPYRSVQGTVMAFDRQSGRLQWTRKMDPRTLVTPQERSLPVLLCFYRIRGPNRAVHESYLELRDPATGDVIHEPIRVYQSKWLAIEHDPVTQQIRIPGRSGTVTIDYVTGQNELTSRRASE